MIIKRLLENYIKYNFIAKPVMLYFLIIEPFDKKRDFFEEMVDVLTNISDSIRKEKDLGFFCIIENMDLAILKTSYRMKFLILRKFVFYVLKDIKKEMDDGKL